MGKKVIQEIFGQAPPDVLYHYTNQDGLLGIIRNSELWATHTQYLSDSKEFLHALALVKAEIDLMSSEVSGEEFALLSQMKRWQDLSLEKLNVFVCSFSQAPDSLTQWRAYGDPTSGFSIGFDGKLLSEAGLKSEFYLAKCVYDIKNQRRLIRRLIRDLLNDGMRNRERPEFNFVESLIRCAPVFKDAHYESEREWRLISIPFGSKSPNLGHRRGKSTLIPFYKLPLKKDSEGAGRLYKEIIVGPTPHSELSVQSLKSFLWAQGIKNCSLRESKVPYRNW